MVLGLGVLVAQALAVRYCKIIVYAPEKVDEYRRFSTFLLVEGLFAFATTIVPINTADIDQVDISKASPRLVRLIGIARKLKKLAIIGFVVLSCYIVLFLVLMKYIEQ